MRYMAKLRCIVFPSALVLRGVPHRLNDTARDEFSVSKTIFLLT